MLKRNLYKFNKIHRPCVVFKAYCFSVQRFIDEGGYMTISSNMRMMVALSVMGLVSACASTANVTGHSDVAPTDKNQIEKRHIDQLQKDIAQTDKSADGNHTAQLGMANPASVYCVEQGGKSVIQEDAQGNQIGYCQLPQGLVEEWHYFRSHNNNLQDRQDNAGSTQKCISEAAQRLVGQQIMGEATLKQITQATQLRMLGPNDAMTEDYRIERLTIVVDPQTKIILSANCG